MPITNPFSISFGGFTAGGATDYQLLGPYVLNKSHQSLKLGFDVVISGTSYADLRTKSDALETAYAKRLNHGDTLVISLDGNSWTYTMGSTMLKAAAEIVKAGNAEIDRGTARSYTVAIEAELPATATNSLRDLEVMVELQATRQRTVTMRGIYTASASGSAVANYSANFDAEAVLYLTAIDPTATWELVNETFTMDREKNGSTPRSNTCPFTRQYTELLYDQRIGVRDDPAIRDHRISFTDMAQFPGDAEPETYRLRRASGAYECSVDRSVTQDLKTVYETKLKDHIKLLFESTYQPIVYGVEDLRVAYDFTGNRVQVTFQFLYQPTGGTQTVESNLSVTYRENRTLDMTPVHNGNEMAFNVDPGFTIVERIWNRSALILEQINEPNTRITGMTRQRQVAMMPAVGTVTSPDQRVGGVSNGVGTRPIFVPGSGSPGGDGWHTVSSTSEIRPVFMGDPAFGVQIRATHITDTVVEHYASDPGSGSSPDFPFPGRGGGL